MAEPSVKLLEALALAFEVCGGGYPSAAAAAFIAAELAKHDEDDVIAALQECMRTVTGRLTLAAILKIVAPRTVTAEESGWRTS